MHRKNEKGFILPIALIVLLMLSFLGMKLVELAMQDSKYLNDNRQRAGAYYQARSGAEMAIRLWQEAPSDKKVFTIKETTSSGRFVTKVIKISDDVYQVISEGFQNDELKEDQDDPKQIVVAEITTKPQLGDDKYYDKVTGIAKTPSDSDTENAIAVIIAPPSKLEVNDIVTFKAKKGFHFTTPVNILANRVRLGT
ncbi:hypothetical protein [Heliophilum fasciatum]|uniref:PilX-like prepilin protein n=1 Tax=Heliophilum fasciatum TaxID=35700 RepID=A0A4R2RIJ0_9FIRM|nr:hypothetical protein [Heliophilum fasciatum]MCW2278644.1 hypothetical protein [Heliophilum fasciatum]TCP62654.1 hypothetical protein EDD73_1191 [Heliophilum fasciatum]